MNNIKINIPADLCGSIEIYNELTNFLDRYNIVLPIGDDYRELVKTYIHIDNLDVKELLYNLNNFHVLSFRIPGATRGGIRIKEVNRTQESNKDNIIIEYEIVDIEFIEETCFTIFKAYTPDVVNASKKEIIGTKLIININI